MTLTATGLINRFLAQAKRRHWTNLGLEYLGIAASVGALGLILLLLLGTQVFDWYWPLILFAAALLAGLWFARRRMLSAYRLAQVVDGRLGLQDRLATVVFFSDHECQSEACLDTVVRQASERIEHEDVRRAVPIRVPRHAYYSLALLAAAGGLVGVRYGVLRTLELEQPLARIDFGMFHQSANVHAASKKSVIQERLEQQLRDLGLDVEQNDVFDENAMQPIEANVPAEGEGGQQMQDPSGKREGQTPPGVQEVEGMEEGGEKSGEGSEAGEGAPSDNPQGQQAKQQNPPKDPKAGDSGRDGLMNKMKDALANLLNKMKSATQSEQQQSASLNQQSASNARQQSSDQGMQSRSKSEGQGQPSPDQQGEEGAGEKSPSEQSRAGDKSADQPGDQNSKTGMGRQDGEKEIRDAEQLAAMGKISEIFGKRAQQLTGEITVEVASKRQTLKTAYTRQSATHSDTGAEVNRDEIPLAYQSYVQRYFEEVRKTATPAKKN